MNPEYPEIMNDMISAFKSFPGIGKRSAVRMAFAVLKWPIEKQKGLGNIFCELNEKIGKCPRCGNISVPDQLCRYCSDPSRDHSTICVVEDVMQISNIESSGLYRGGYHVLGGKIAPLEGMDAENLNISSLTERAGEENVKEIIIALGQDVEGQATSIYISGLLKDRNVQVTRLARGLPAGSDIAYADSATIAAALNGRTSLPE